MCRWKKRSQKYSIPWETSGLEGIRATRQFPPRLARNTISHDNFLEHSCGWDRLGTRETREIWPEASWYWRNPSAKVSKQWECWRTLRFAWWDWSLSSWGIWTQERGGTCCSWYRNWSPIEGIPKESRNLHCEIRYAVWKLYILAKRCVKCKGALWIQ